VVLLVVTPESVFGMLVSAQALVVALFGGVGTLWGPVIGAAILIPLSETLQAHLGNVIPGIQGVVYGGAIILVVLLAPEGIFWRVRDRLARSAAPAPAVELAPAPTVAVKSPDVPIRSPDGAPLLIVSGLSKSFGGLRAVADVSFDVHAGEILGIIGPNGAGKTTLFNLLDGFLPPDAGDIRFAGQPIVRLKPNRICRLGIGRTFQVVRAFPRLSVLHNVVVGAYVATRTDAEALAAAAAALERVGLLARADAPAGGLTNKELRLMELARALAGNPRLLLMDEPLAGLAAPEIEDMLGVVRALPSLGANSVPL
jgi:ABC-type branched-subunit amino acid transport system ATPase component